MELLLTSGVEKKKAHHNLTWKANLTVHRKLSKLEFYYFGVLCYLDIASYVTVWKIKKKCLKKILLCSNINTKIYRN